MDILRELELFLTLVEEGSFTAAADRLGVPRATLSRRLSRYEEDLGHLLFERSTRHLRLTEAGHLLALRGAPILALIGLLERLVPLTEPIELLRDSKPRLLSSLEDHEP